MTKTASPIKPAELPARTGSSYPEQFRARVVPREKRALGDAAGLTRIGVNHTVLYPGAESALRHWHTHEDEFIWVLEGELVLRTDAGEQVLAAGMGVGFPAGRADGHQLVNRGTAPAVYLEISNRDGADQVFYPDEDLLWNPPGAPDRFTRRDGSPY
jgi:uncharacterized cupin superfamily protein